MIASASSVRPTAASAVLLASSASSSRAAASARALRAPARAPVRALRRSSSSASSSASSAVSRRAAARSSVVVKAELKEGDRLQDYPDYYRVLKADDGSSVALSSFENKQPVVLAFYPAASTPGCTKEMCSIRDSWSALTATKAAVFGISGDEPAKNAAFRAANRLPFKLLSDSGNFLRKSFGIKGDLLGLLPGRQTIVVDKKGVVRKIFNSQFEVEKHVEAALEALKAL